MHSDNWEKLWNATKKKFKRSLSHDADHSDYVMLWRLKEINSFVPAIMADLEKKEDDDCWRFSSQEEKHDERRQNRVFASHVLVFDESMSAIVRC